MVFQDISARSGDMNHEVAQGDPTFHLVVRGSDYHTDYAFNMNATAVSPRAIVYGTWNIYLNIYFAMVLPANVSYYSGYIVFAYIHTGSFVYANYTSIIYGNYTGARIDAYPVSFLYGFINRTGVFLVKGVPMGQAGIGFWNVTLYPVPPPEPWFGVGESHDWLWFTTQTDMHLSIFLLGDGNLTAANGTVYEYTLVTIFSFQRTTAIYSFGYPVAAYLGYGVSILIGVASMRYIITTRGRRKLGSSSVGGITSDLKNRRNDEQKPVSQS